MKITGGNGKDGIRGTHNPERTTPVISRTTTNITSQPTSQSSDGYARFTPEDVANAVLGPLPSALRA